MAAVRNSASGTERLRYGTWLTVRKICGTKSSQGYGNVAVRNPVNCTELLWYVAVRNSASGTEWLRYGIRLKVRSGCGAEVGKERLQPQALDFQLLALAVAIAL